MEKNMAKVRPIPEGYHTVTPYLSIKGAAKALEFYKKAFNATELFRMEAPGGLIGHAEIKIGNSHIMLADEFPGMGCKSPATLHGTPVGLMLYVEDVDHLSKQAVTAGMKVQRPVQDQFYGDRSGTFEDPFGHVWTISTHVEDVPPAEMEKRAAKHAAEMKNK
jgi:PhnB protein